MGTWPEVAHRRQSRRPDPGTTGPVGSAWESVRTSESPLDLHSPDKNHANHRGAYLTALVLYGAITDDRLPDDPWHPPELSSDEVEQLVEAADEV